MPPTRQFNGQGPSPRVRRHTQWLTLAGTASLTLVRVADIDQMDELEASGILTGPLMDAALALLTRSHDDEDEEQPEPGPRAALPRSGQTTQEG